MEEEVKEVKKEFKLPNKKVTVRLVDRPRGVIRDRNHVGYNMLPGTTFDISVPRKRNSSEIDCPLNAEEIEFFQNKKLSGMSFSIGDLSPHNPDKTNYWCSKRARVTLTDRPKTLDLSKPSDYLIWKILLKNTDLVAPSIDEEFNKKTYVFVIVSEEDEQRKVTTKGDKNKRAWKLAAKMEDNTEAMIDFLTVAGKRPSKNSKKGFLVAEIDKFIEENIEEFLKILEDPNYETRLLLSKAVQVKAVLRDGHKYFLPGGDELCEKGEVNNLTSVLRFLDKPENQDIRLTLEAKIKDY